MHSHRESSNRIVVLPIDGNGKKKEAREEQKVGEMTSIAGNFSPRTGTARIHPNRSAHIISFAGGRLHVVAMSLPFFAGRVWRRTDHPI